MENKIDWNFWLKRKSILEIEMALLTLGLNPENFEKDFFMDCHYLVNRDDLQTIKEDYDKRMIFIRENRFTPYKYMANEDDSSIFYFNSRGTIKVKKFLLWLKNEDMGWDLPPELKNYIDLMGNSKNSINIETNHKRLNPNEWHQICGDIALKALNQNCEYSSKEVIKIILENFQNEGILSSKGKPFSKPTIERYLSEWGFNAKRANIRNNKNS
ncbi:hypothetical protein [Polynucleobacter kasalickyi]|uniref:Uncharacterized protein n=1 Tax=Polynucleobacter kasalickyi TaxID=1938817 RepID=A0A1W2AG68_9BURK|nr:hypothetical protein [Polynucleobacter kasalickyi]SMC59709.1 hypothetical protein SAMN06296008_108139 [Polynucleobacter kasalickyi]